MNNENVKKGAEPQAEPEKEIINGYQDGSFRGENKVTRAEITKMLVTAFNISADGGAEKGGYRGSGKDIS